VSARATARLEAEPAIRRETLRGLLADLHAHRVATMRAEELAVNINQRQLLVDTADRSHFVKVGDIVAPFSLPEVQGGTVTLDGLLTQGPAVLIFFRFAGCPACNIALPYYQRQLYPSLNGTGASLVAISPQIPARLLDIKQRHNLPFAVAPDIGNELARRFGILYSFDEPSKRAWCDLRTSLRIGWCVPRLAPSSMRCARRPHKTVPGSAPPSLLFVQIV
jgi:peroxiredoxin